MQKEVKMVSADETVVVPTNSTTVIESTEPKSSDVSGNSSDSDGDKIEKLKADQRDVVIEPVNGSTNGSHAETNGEETTEATVETVAAAAEVVTVEDEDMEEAPKLEVECIVVEENGQSVEQSATTSTPGAEEGNESNETNEVEMKEVDTVDEVKEVEMTDLTDENEKEDKNGNETSKETEKEITPVNGVAPETVAEPAERTNEEESAPPELQQEEGEQNGKGVKRTVECIQLDDDDDDIQEIPATPAKKAKVDPTASPVSPAVKVEDCNDNEKAQKRLLDRLEEYVHEQKGTPSGLNRKVLDTLLGAINAQVQKEPLSVRKLILDKDLVLPNTISFPPSQVCDILIEHDPGMPLTKVINRMFGEERPKLSDSEKRERNQLKLSNPVPNMTKLLVDIGQDLVQEATYCDIVHAKNLPEVPKNLETYKQVAAQLKPVWETLKRKNEPYKLKMHRCGVCGFQTESKLVMTGHKATLHYTGSKFQCTLCKDTDTNEQRMKEHYFEAHLVIAKPEEKEAKYPCMICEEDFNYKGVREQHYKTCKKDYIRIRNIMTPTQGDLLHLNRWLWEKPAMDPSILQQQQAAALQQAQQKRQQQQLLSQQQAAAAAALLRKQQLQQQQLQQNRLREQTAQAQQAQQLRQVAAFLQQHQQQQQHQNNRGNINNTLIAAMQAHLRRSGQAVPNQAQMTQALQKQIAAATKSQQGAQLQAAMVAAALKSQSPKVATQQKTPRSSVGITSQPLTLSSSTPSSSVTTPLTCEICDQNIPDKERYLLHLQSLHKQMVGKSLQDMSQGAPLACSRCRDRFWTYEGLERHLVMSHGLVTADLLLKAQKKEDGGRCKTCGKQYAFNMLQHLVADHQVKLCSAEIMYSCDVCAFKCSSYQILETHLSTTHPKGDKKTTPAAKKDDCITLDD
ncbi:unnamed protein product [Caenorhabditis sp. 36 PRJEB53466]|nr:unnamed protein product [Caenorhabditis sp. 36 PRJEB53466]